MSRNATLASLNSVFHSPTSPTKSRLWQLDDTAAGVVRSYLDDDFQSNMTLQAYDSYTHSGSSQTASTGLGIFYPSIARMETQDVTGGPKSTFCYDLAYRPRNITRTESIYDAEIAPGFLEEPSSDPFTLSSFLVSPDFLRDDLDLLSNEPVIESSSEPTPYVLAEEQRPIAPVDRQGRWVLQRILEASGHTVESLSTELRTFFGGPGLSSTTNSAQEVGLQSSSTYALKDVLRYPDDSPVLSINPAAIMSVQPIHGRLLPSPPTETPDLGLAEEEDSEAEKPPVPLASLPFIPQPLSSPIPLTNQVLEELEEAILPNKRESDYEPSLSPSAESSNESAFIPIFSRRKAWTRSTRVPRRQSVKRVLLSPYIVPSDSIITEPVVPDFPIDYGTPVLDAHRGIEQSELKAKAARYRERNQGVEYDKKWLLSFAGKLTPQGLMTEEYRCYIVGCNQSNRRRDHILIHVGGHLDQRPFACTHCPARFLRKNECKRHELSHSGARPFTCDLCPLGVTAFVRQDLLKRHQKRTHNIDNTRVRTAKRHRQN